MPKVKISEGMAKYWCPGCNSHHIIPVQPIHYKVIWDWNGSVESPTFQPSVLIYPSDAIAEDVEIPTDLTPEWLEQHKIRTPRCHHFIVDGKIQYLADCDHSLAGQTIEMSEV